eukprot:SAG11_NODE_1214_length_5503_cov_5.844560_2_plen_791_part_00
MRMLMVAAMMMFAATRSQAASRSIVVTSLDKSVSVAVDPQTGEISSLTSRGMQHSIVGGVTLQGTRPLEISAKSVGEGGESVLITQTVCIPAADVPCSSKQAKVNSLFTPRATSVGWTLNISSPVYSTDPTPLWTAPVVTNITFANSGDKQFWAPWSRGETKDPLTPSDGGFSWWTGEYLLGAQVVPASDHVIHEMATVLDPTHNVGVSFIPSPANPPAHPTWLNISGAGMDCHTADACSGPGWFAVSRHHLRFGDGAHPHIFDTDIVAHEACWRAALGWSVRAHAEYWEPVNPVIKEIEGLGSYSSYLGDLTDPKFKKMDYALNWDLSGRFFPYAGQFLPPVKRDEIWLNDGEGTQPRANVSFEIIDEFYGRIQRQGFATLSYFNVFEYGENICGNYPGMAPLCNRSGEPTSDAWERQQGHSAYPAPSSAEPWANSTWFMLENFPKSLVTSYDCGGHKSGCSSTGDATAARNESARRQIGTWQGGVVVDPVDPQLKAHFVAQLERKYKEISNFQGLVVDRSDWNTVYNYDFDDGASFIGNSTAHLSQYSYLDTIAALRDVMKDKEGDMHHNQTVMLQNALGFAQLSLMKDFDGTFSEGGVVNSVGLLGARSTAILWTYDTKECCSSLSVADEYFQRRLHLKVFPMAPFPQADHCIASDPKAEAMYISYGSMFGALRGAKYLLRPHAINVTKPALANVYELPHAPGLATLWSVMLGGNQSSAVLSVAFLPTATTVGATAPGANRFEVMHPGAHDWKPLPPTAAHLVHGGGAAKLTVPLERGCALVRLVVN